MHMCRNVGCTESFKWRMQLSRHVLKCSKPIAPSTDLNHGNKTYSIIDTGDGFQCARCGRKYTFKENVYRHFKMCKLKPFTENKEPNKELVQQLDTNKELVQQLDTNKEVVHEMDTNKELVQELDTNKELVQGLDKVKKEFCCMRCPLSFTSKEALQSHENHCLSAEKKEIMHMCRNVGCNQSFKWRMQLKRHSLKCSKPVVTKTDSIIDTDDGFLCGNCGRKYKFKENVYRHFKMCKQQRNHFNKALNNVNKDFYCFKCHRHFMSKDNLKQHAKQCLSLNEQGVYVDTSNDDNVVLVIPLDENLLPLNDNPEIQPGSTNNITEAQEYGYKPEYVTSTSHFIANSSRPVEVIPSYSHPMDVVPTMTHPIQMFPPLSHSIEYLPNTSRMEVIPASGHPIQHQTFAVDVKTVHRSTCSTCGRDFVRRDHYQRHISKCAKNRQTPGSSAEQIFTCCYCDRKYQRKDHFERHTKKCALLNPLKSQEKKANIKQEFNDTLKVMSNVAKQPYELCKNSTHGSPNLQVKLEPESIDVYAINKKHSCSDQMSHNIPKYTSSSTETNKLLSSSCYSNSRDTNYLWKNSLHGSSNKVTIINNIKKGNKDRSLTLQSVTDKIVNNLTNERRRNLENITLQSIYEENTDLTSNEKNAGLGSTGKLLDRNLTLQNMTEKLIENYSDELSSMDCSEVMSNGKKKYVPRVDKDQDDSNAVKHVDSFLEVIDEDAVLEGIDDSVDVENEKINMVENTDLQPELNTIKVEMAEMPENPDEGKNELMLKNVNLDNCHKINNGIKVKTVYSSTEDISKTDSMYSSSMDIVENVDTPCQLPEPDDIMSLIAPDQGNIISEEKEAEFEKNICEAVIGYLKRLYLNNHSHFHFHKVMREIFQEQLNDRQFVCWLYKRLLP